MSALWPILAVAPVLLALAWALPRRLVGPALATLAAAWLAWRSPPSLALVVALTLATFLAVGRRASPRRAAAVVVMVIAVFVAIKWNARVDDAQPGPVALGFAFYALRLVHVAIERGAGRIPPLGPVELFGYLAFLPALVAGPIHCYAPFARDAGRRRFDAGLLATGLERVLYGLVKVVALGGWGGAHLAAWRASVDHPGAVAWLACLQHGWHIYFTFGGYSDVAIGLAGAAGHSLPENFNWPMLARNPADFWRRWHASLSAWCRDHVFTPVTLHTRRRWVGVLVSLLVLGLWHELSLRYLVWALYHAGGLLAWAAISRAPAPATPVARAVVNALGVALTTSFVILGFAFTSTATLDQGFARFIAALTWGRCHV